MRRARDRYIRGRRLFANRAENGVKSGPATLERPLLV